MSDEEADHAQETINEAVGESGGRTDGSAISAVRESTEELGDGGLADEIVASAASDARETDGSDAAQLSVDGNDEEVGLVLRGQLSITDPR